MSNALGLVEASTSTPCGCGHHDKAHDKIAARFCAATQAAALTRNCVCHPAPVVRRP